MAVSFSGMRKKLEQENICDSLKGRVKYFATRYRKSHDSEGRVAILIDGSELYKSNFYDWAIKRDIGADKLRKEKHSYSSEEFHEKAHINAVDAGGFDQYCFYEAFHIYNNQSIEDSLNSKNAIIRLLAIFDKRTGKKSLLKIKEKVTEQPEWLQQFYKLRLQAENIL